MAATQVPSVYPSGFLASITGLVVSGDGHVSLGTPSGQFGAPSFSQITKVSVGGVSTAQWFGNPTPKVGIAVGGVPTAQGFGQVGIYTHVWITLPGVASAAAFGSAATGFKAFIVWLHQFDCITGSSMSICGDGTICGDGSICGGNSLIEELGETTIDLEESSSIELALAPLTCV